MARLLPPESASLESAARELSISAPTLERWRAEALSGPARERAQTAAARFEAVLVTAAMDETGKSAWCREHGVYPQELEQWRQAAGITVRTLQRWKAHDGLVVGDKRPDAERALPGHALNEDERTRILTVANEPRFAALPPARIVHNDLDLLRARGPGEMASMPSALPFDMVELLSTFGHIGRPVDFVTIAMSSRMVHARRGGGPGLVTEVIVTVT